MGQLMFAMQVLEALPGLLATGRDVVQLVQNTNASLAKMQVEARDPTDEEWRVINEQIAELRKELHAV